jgi:hypothetical protein
MEFIKNTTILDPATPGLVAGSLTIFAPVMFVFAAALVISTWKSDGLPHANPKMRFFPTTMAQMDFAKHGTEIFNRAKKQFPGKPFRMITNVGDTLVLPPRFANLIQNNKTLNFRRTVVRVSCLLQFRWIYTEIIGLSHSCSGLPATGAYRPSRPDIAEYHKETAYYASA